jgi:hypothetical protein
MKVELNIGYKQLIDLINQLPPDDINKLKAEIDRILNKVSSTADDEWESLLLNGPVMDDEQYRVFEENRQKFDQ